LLRLVCVLLVAAALVACDLTGEPSEDEPAVDEGAAATPRAPISTLEAPEICGTPVPPGATTVTLQVNGQQRSFELYVPAGYDPVDRHALLFDFHGAGGTGAGQSTYSGVYAVADQGEFVVVSPDADPVRRTWDFDGGEDADFVAAMVSNLETRVCLDTSRIYAMGFSDGATFANVLACEEGFNLAGIGIVAGGGSARNCEPRGPLDVMIMHGTDDPILPYAGIQPDQWAADWAELNGCESVPATEDLGQGIGRATYVGCPPDGEVVFYRIEGGGHTWPGADQTLLGDVGSTTQALRGTLEIARFFGLIEQ
jgi:polyhydroxybutyrate depolymerase